MREDKINENEKEKEGGEINKNEKEINVEKKEEKEKEKEKNVCNNSPCVASTPHQVVKCVQEYHMNLCGTLVSKKCATNQMQQICSSCYNLVCCVKFALIYISQPE